MDQNPGYFPGFFTADRKVDVQVMDRMLLERCMPWIFAEDDLTSEAALHEYVDAVISIIGIDGANPRHRHDVQEQALSTINVLVNRQGGHASTFTNQETRMYMREQFLKRMNERLLEIKYGNAYSVPRTELDRRRAELREVFRVVLDVDPSVMPIVPGADEVPLLAYNEHRNTLSTPSHIQVECPYRRRGLELARALGREAQKRGWKVDVVFNESGQSGTLEIHTRSLTRIQTRHRYPDDAVRAMLQPVEEFLRVNGCNPGAVRQEDPRWLTIQWLQQ